MSSLYFVFFFILRTFSLAFCYYFLRLIVYLINSMHLAFLSFPITVHLILLLIFQRSSIVNNVVGDVARGCIPFILLLFLLSISSSSSIVKTIKLFLNDPRFLLLLLLVFRRLELPQFGRADFYYFF